MSVSIPIFKGNNVTIELKAKITRFLNSSNFLSEVHLRSEFYLEYGKVKKLMSKFKSSNQFYCLQKLLISFCCKND